MDFFQNKRVQRQSGKHKGKRLTQDQVRVLEKSFTSNKKLDPERKLQLAAELGVPSRQVAIWYQNRRARWKTQTLEVDYSALQVKLDSALAEKRVLEKDLEMIRAELRNAQEMLALANLSRVRPTSNFAPRYSRDRAAPGSCEEGGGSSNSSLNGDLDMNCCWEDENKTLQLDDLYACVMFANGSTRLD